MGSLTAQEYICDGQDVADQASERIPTATHTGIVNTRFQWPPGALDIPLYVYQRHLKPWIEKHQEVILKYAPKVIQYAWKIYQEKNYFIAAVPGVLKVLKKW
jgi:hypothetical protein